MVYTAAVFKYFWEPTIRFFVVYVIASNIIGETLSLNGGMWEGGGTSLVIAILLGTAVLIVSAFLGYLISLAFYKKPVSKMSQSANLRKYM